LRCEDEHNWWITGEDLLGSIRDVSEGTLQHMSIISEENYEVSYLSVLN